jgi:hypothetical protein
MERARDIPFEVFTACRRRDLVTLRYAVERLRTHLEPKDIVVATARKNFGPFERALGSAVKLVDEDELIPGMTLAGIRHLSIQYFPRAAGWYFQQLLKYAWCFQNASIAHYLVWDADTILLKPLSFFDEQGRLLMTKSKEYHAAYFETFEKLFGVPASYEFSFISQHQMVDKMLLQEMLRTIAARFPASLNWAWAILQTLPSIGKNLFSEYETYGHWLKYYHPDRLRYRDVPWLREGTEVAGFPPSEKKLDELAKRYFFTSFESRKRPFKKVISRLWEAAHALKGQFTGK